MKDFKIESTEIVDEVEDSSYYKVHHIPCYNLEITAVAPDGEKKRFRLNNSLVEVVD